MWRSLLVFFGLWTMVTWAQEPYAVHFGRKDGLPTSNVYCAMQDREGYMWFGTDIGVLRFDGANFQHYSTEDGLGDNEVFGCYQDPEGRIWFSTYNGRISYYQNGRFYNDAQDKRLMRAPEPTMMLKVTGDSKGNVFFLYRNVYHISFNPTTGSRLHSNGRRFEVLDVFRYQNENLLFFRNGVTDQQQRPRFTFRRPEYRKHICRTLRWRNCIYFSDGDRLYSFDGHQQRLVANLGLEHDEIISIHIDSKEDLWLGTRNGLFRRKLRDGRARFSHFLKGHTVSSVAEDFERTIWVTTLDDGVFMIPSRHMTAIKKRDGSDVVANCLSSHKGELWAGGFSSDYYRWHNGMLTENTTQTPSPNSVLSQIYHKDDFTAIVGSAGFRFIDHNRIRDVDMPGGKALYVDPKGLNWIGMAAMFRIDRATMYNLSHHTIREKDSSVVLRFPTYCVIANDQYVWAGTKKGVYRISLSKPNQRRPLPTPDGPTTILTLYKTGDVLFAGTDSKGLLVYRNEKLVQELTKRSGLGSNSIYAIKPGIHPNTVFISHNAGVDEVLIKKGRCTVTNLNRALGLGQTRVNDTEIVGDTLFIASDEALLAIAAHDIRGISIPPRISIRKVTVNDTHRLANGTKLSYDQNEVRIFFGGISFRSGKNIRYRYKLDGYDRGWTISGETDIRYKALPPGHYRFTVAAINVSGTSSAPVNFEFTIREPFWLRWPFIVIALLVITGVVYGIWKRRLRALDAQFAAERDRIRRERDRARLEKKAAELEQKVLLMQMNPHFIFNALNTIKGYYSERNDDLAGTYITKFSRLLRLLLENAEQQISLATEIQMLTLYMDLALIRYPDAFDYRIDSEPNMNRDEVAIPTLLLQPLIENAIIHGLAPKKTKGLLEVSFRRDGDRLVCTVQDDGIGRTASATRNRHRDHDGKAIEITRERLQLMAVTPGETNFRITDRYDEKGEAAGTTVTLIIPFKTIW